MSTEEAVQPAEEVKETNKLRVLGWFTVGIALAAVGVLVGRELRSRYKFNRRTPYDFYSSADEKHSNDFGLGV
jgi:hypothetical protein